MTASKNSSSPKDSLRQKILEKAVLTARNNAGILVKAAGVKLESILNIEYNWTEIRFGGSNEFSSDFISSLAFEMEPTDIIGGDSVTITWEILEN